MILTAREPAGLRREILPLGMTQTDASTRIGIGAYSETYSEQEAKRQQFLIGDTRSLEELIGELADAGYITSFCTAGYRCGRTGKRIMDMLSKGSERWLCKLNAVLTFREWLDDYASDKTKSKGERIIEKEIAEIRQSIPGAFAQFSDYYRRVKNGERDLYF
jgi:2-iminoacetate synthase